MNGHWREVSGNNPIVLTQKKCPEEDREEDQVTDAISKLQQNGVNCILFTKDELLNLNNNHSRNDHHHFHYNNKMRKTKEEQNYNDLLDYEPSIKSFNPSSLTIQITNHNNCLVSTEIKGKRGRKKGKRRKRFSPKKIQKKVISTAVSSSEKRKRGGKWTNQEIVLQQQSPYNLRRQSSSSGSQSFLEPEGDFIHDYLTNGFSTPSPPLPLPPPCLSPSCPIPSAPDDVKDGENGRECSSPLILPLPSHGSDDREVLEDVEETMKRLLENVLREVGDGVVEGCGERNQSLDYVQLEKTLSFAQETEELETIRGGEALENMEEQPCPFEQNCYFDETSLPLVVPDAGMKLRHSTPDGSFYSLVTQNVRHNLENYLDGRVELPPKKYGGTKRRKRYKNGYLLYHGDNYPQDPELSYKLNLTTQILLKLNRKRCYKPKTDKRKTMLAYLNLIPKRPVRTGKSVKVEEAKHVEASESPEAPPVFSGEWTLENKYVCGICRHEETDFWDMVTHKGEEHSGVVVTHVELPVNQIVPETLIRDTAEDGNTTEVKPIPPCTKCAAKFSSYLDLHRHIFECSGNANWLVEPQAPKKPTKARRRRRQGFKRRLSNNTPKKNAASGSGGHSTKAETPTKRKINADGSTTSFYKCKFCVRHFKTEGWLKNHLATHTLLVSIPFSKLPKRKPSLPQLIPESPRASNWSLRKYRRAAALVAAL